MNDEMDHIVICKHCGEPEYYGEMRWLSGKCFCRDCYKREYQSNYGEPYKWHDLDGDVPTKKAFQLQESARYDEQT